MTDDLTPHYHRLTHSAALVGEFEGRPERQAELLAWVLEAVRAIAAARGLALETGPEPLPRDISRDLRPAQGSGDEEPPRCAAADASLNEATGRLEMVGTCARCGFDRAHHLRTHWEDCLCLRTELGWPTLASPALFDESEDPDLGLIDAGMQWPMPARTIIEAGAGFAPGELRRPGACDPAEDGAERVMQAAETWWGRRG